MKAKWIISNLGKRDNSEGLAYSVQEIGREARILNLGEIAEMEYLPSDESDCVITRGSIWTNSSLKKSRPNWTGNCHNKEMFKCSSYYPCWGQFLTQKNYLFLPLTDILRKKDWLYDVLSPCKDILFLRPDSGEKEFEGEVIHRDRFDAWSEETRERLELANTPPYFMCVASSPVDIAKEYRLVIADKKVIAGSTYRIAKHLASEPLDLEIDKSIFEFAETVLNHNPPPLPPFHVLDIAVESDGNLSIMEVGCFCCCGLYTCDLRQVAKGISECAEKQWELRNKNDQR